MNIRKILSMVVKDAKKLSGKTYDELVEETGCSKTSIRYALNGGDGVGLDTFQKLFDCLEVDVEISSVTETPKSLSKLL